MNHDEEPVDCLVWILLESKLMELMTTRRVSALDHEAAFTAANKLVELVKRKINYEPR